MNAFRLRRALSLSSRLFNQQCRPLSSIAFSCGNAPVRCLAQPDKSVILWHCRPFRSSTASFSSRYRSYNDSGLDDEITPDTILFEGCDYNHWLITMDFPKDPKPSAEEMVETYVQTAAKVLGSVEEAKKKIYACSTTTYQGFQVEVSEEVSEKFKGLPGVVFVLPDSYIDPVNKEYGGDKYINGTIIPRPPPIQYGRSGGRYNDRNRDYNRRPRSQTQYPQGNSLYNNQSVQQSNGSTAGERRESIPMSNTPHQSSDSQLGYQRGNSINYETSVGGGCRQGHGQDGGGNFGHGQGGSGNFGHGQGGGGNFGHGPGGGKNLGHGQGAGGNLGHGQGAGGNLGHGQGVGGNLGHGQGAGGNFGLGQGAGGNFGHGQGAGGNFGHGQGAGGNFGHGQGVGGNLGHGQGAGGNFGHGQGAGGNFGHRQGAGRNFGHGQGAGGNFGHGQGEGGHSGLEQNRSSGHNQNYPEQRYASPLQRGFRGDNQGFASSQPGEFGHGPSGNYGQGTGGTQGQGRAAVYGQQHTHNETEQRFSEGEQQSMPGDQRNYSSTSLADQGRY